MLAELVGISIDDSELPEVANRFGSLMQELDRLRELDLEGLEPVTIFPDTEFPGPEFSETGSDD